MPFYLWGGGGKLFCLKKKTVLGITTEVFVLRKKGNKTKNRMKEEEIEKGDCGPPTRKVF